MLDFIKLPPTTRHTRRFVEEIAAGVPPGQTVIDAGAGECQYKPLFGHARYIAVDLCVGDANWDFSGIDINAPLHDIPLSDRSADVILCTEVLEHVPNPHQVVAELARLLKPGGSLYVSVPFSGREHQVPYDFFRYTQYGLRHLCDQAGLEVEYVRPVRGDFYRAYCVLGEQGAHIKGRIWQLPLLLLKLYLALFIGKLEAMEKDSHGACAWHCKAVKR
jgi:SAM-dependent methyltransferase